jgi:hypothetical protein
MSVKIELQGSGAGRGVLLIGGRFPAPESVALAVERNDGRYLGLRGVWQTTPHWHPQFGVQPFAGGMRLDLAPEIVDGVIAVGGVPLRFLVRADGVEHAGVLRIRGELIGSDGAAPTRLRGADEAPLSLEPDSDEITLLAPPPAFAVPRGAPVAPAPSRAWLWVTLSLLLLGAAAIGAAWYLGWLDPWLAPTETLPPTPVPTEQAPDEPPSEPVVPPEPAPATEATSPAVETVQPEPPPEPDRVPVKGIAFARAFLEGDPPADAVYAQAIESDTGGDCEAALVLYNAAADADPRHAAELARRYDPLTFAAGTCIDRADAPYAIVYFEDAAKAGDAAAQRRLGQLMTEREPSGATYEEGVAWLRKAAAAGDAEAQRALDALGK